MKKERLYGPLIAVVTLTVIFALVATIGFFGLIKQTFPGFSIADKEDSPAPTVPEPEIPYVSLDAQTPAFAVVEGMSNYIPPALSGYGNTGLGGGTPQAPFTWVCPVQQGPVSPAVASLRNFSAGKDSWATMVVQAYGAGQGTVATQRYEDAVRNCSGRDGGGYRTSSSVPFEAAEGFKGSFSAGGQRYHTVMWNQGDVAVSVTGTDVRQVEQAAVEYNEYLLSVLTPVCLTTTLPASDATRSPYVDINAYTGWQRGREVILNPAAPGLAPGYLPAEGEVSGQGVPRGNVPPSMAVDPQDSVPGPVLEVATVQLPRKPLEPFTPASLPTAVEHPGSAPTAPEIPATSTTVPERVRDDEGPGCGWNFTGQKPPVYDDSAEKARADGLAAEAHAKLVADQIAYQNARSVYLVAYADYAYRVQKYNEYANQVAAVAAAWNDINNKRAVYRAALDQYYRDVDNFENFFDRQAQAQVDYDAALARCVAQEERRAQYEEELTAWEEAMEEWTQRQKEREEEDAEEPQPAPEPSPSPSPAPTPSPSPTTPVVEDPPPVKPVFEETEQCPAPRPAILDQRAPSQPVPPQKPDVPLPSAWNDIPN